MTDDDAPQTRREARDPDRRDPSDPASTAGDGASGAGESGRGESGPSVVLPPVAPPSAPTVEPTFTELLGIQRPPAATDAAAGAGGRDASADAVTPSPAEPSPLDEWFADPGPGDEPVEAEQPQAPVDAAQPIEPAQPSAPVEPAAAPAPPAEPPAPAAAPAWSTAQAPIWNDPPPTVAMPAPPTDADELAVPPAQPTSARPPAAVPPAAPTTALPSAAPTTALPPAAAAAAVPAVAASTVHPGVPAAAGDGAGSGDDGGAGGGGLAAMIRKHPRAWLAGALGAAFLLLGTGSVLAGVAVGSGGEGPVQSSTGEEVVARSVPGGVGAASRVNTCSPGAQTANPGLKTLHGSVIVADTGRTLFDREGADPAQPGGAQKVLTAAAAISVLGPTFQMATRVLDGTDDGSVALVGRGDATLSRTQEGQESVYAGAPKLSDLAEQTVEAYQTAHPDGQITSVVLDASYWDAVDKWDDSWPRTEQTGGRQSEVTALQVDGDRDDPVVAVSPRSTDPIDRAGDAFVEALQAADPDDVVADDVQVEVGTAASGTALLGEVKSQPLSRLIAQMFASDDHTLAEMMARVTSVESGNGGTAASLTNAISSALSTYGVAFDDLAVRDGSGLSVDNAVAPAQLAEFMAEVRGGKQNLDVVNDALSVAGESGLLAPRFTGEAEGARGAVTAAAGSTVGASTITGYLDAADGTLLLVSVTAVGDGIDTTTFEALDALVARFHTCGANLANA